MNFRDMVSTDCVMVTDKMLQFGGKVLQFTTEVLVWL